MLLQSLCELIGPDALSAVPQFETMPTSSEQFVGDTGATTLPNSKQPPVPEPIAPVSELPDFTLVHVMPWWFLLGATAFCVLLAWILRGFWWHKWTMLAMAAIAAFVVLYSWSRKGNDSHSVKRFRSRARIGGSAIFAAACGALISIFFPLGTIFIDNESGVNVRLLINDEEWTSIGTGESKQKGLTRGTYRLTIQSMEGNHVFDAYDIDISSYEKYVLNVLSGQIYFHGTVQYGIAGGESKAITAKWLKLPEVDYLFRDPPKAIVTVNPVNKTFFLKGLGPQ